MGRDAPRLGFAPHQLAQGESTAPTQQFITPFIVQAPPFIQYEKHLDAGVAKQHVRWLVPGGVEPLLSSELSDALQPTASRTTASDCHERRGTVMRISRERGKD